MLHILLGDFPPQSGLVIHLPLRGFKEPGRVSEVAGAGQYQSRTVHGLTKHLVLQEPIAHKVRDRCYESVEAQNTVDNQTFTVESSNLNHNTI